MINAAQMPDVFVLHHFRNATVVVGERKVFNPDGVFVQQCIKSNVCIVEGGFLYVFSVCSGFSY